MKELIDEITGRKDLPIFKGSNDSIRNWIYLHIDQIEQLNEPFSCDVLLDGDNIIISGDEDYRELKIIEAEFLELD